MSIIQATYLVSTIAATIRRDGYELKLIEGFCPITKAAANINSHDPKADMQHPYNRIETMVQDTVSSAEGQDKFAHITIKIEQDAPMWPEDACYILNQQDLKNVVVVDTTKESDGYPEGCHVITIQNV